MRNEPAVGAPVRFELVIMTPDATSGDAGAHAGRKFGRVGPVRV